jgi:hypothetical protein
MKSLKTPRKAKKLSLVHERLHTLIESDLPQVNCISRVHTAAARPRTRLVFPVTTLAPEDCLRAQEDLRKRPAFATASRRQVRVTGCARNGTPLA